MDTLANIKNSEDFYALFNLLEGLLEHKIITKEEYSFIKNNSTEILDTWELVPQKTLPLLMFKVLRENGISEDNIFDELYYLNNRTFISTCESLII